MKEFHRYRKIVVCAQQAGAAAVLAPILTARPGGFSGKIYAYPPAAPFFEKAPIDCVIPDKTDAGKAAAILKAEAPEAVLVGSSIGYSLEKTLIVESLRRGIPVFCFVDHYWNLWQRFAHHRTAARWHYLPSRIYVIDRQSRQRIVELGCPAGLVRVHPHPVLDAIRTQPAQLSPAKTRQELQVSSDAKLTLFISEWEYRNSGKWQYEQPKRADVLHLLLTILRIVEQLRRKGGPKRVVLIKTHPAENVSWERHLRPFDAASYRIISQFDKASLFDACEAVFGLNSMMMLEALARGRKVYSLHKERTSPQHWLSTWNPRIHELRTAADCEHVLENI
jgi:hypothetical protein